MRSVRVHQNVLKFQDDDLGLVLLPVPLLAKESAEDLLRDEEVNLTDFATQINHLNDEL